MGARHVVNKRITEWVHRMARPDVRGGGALGRPQVRALERYLYCAVAACAWTLALVPASAMAQAGGPPTLPARRPMGRAIVPTPEIQAKAQALVSGMMEPELTLDVDPRYSKLLTTKHPVSRISITHPDILEVVQFSPTEFELIGGATGETTFTMWFAGPNGQPDGQILRYLVRVFPNLAIEDRRKTEYGDLERKINELFPNSLVTLTPVADKLIVRGQARDSQEAMEILAVLRGEGGEAQGAGGSPLAMGAAVQPYAGRGELPRSSIINLLDVPGEMQVLLKVRIAELSRSALRQMGTTLNLDFGDFSFNSTLGLNGAVSAVLNTDDVRLTLEALSTNSYAKILAEPNLVTLSGHPAYFIAGGEFAVPVVVGVEGAAGISATFRGFGTQLAFTPTVIDKDRIRLQVTPSFSSLNHANSVEGIPGLDTRAVVTTVDLREGQWLAIAGLIQDQQEGSKVRVPLLGDIPVLDTLFSKRRVKRDETELLVLISPELVHPLEAEESPLILPGMEVTEPGDCAFFLAGAYEGRPSCHHRSTVWPIMQQQAWAARCESKRQPRYQQCEDYYIQGDHGFSK